MFFVERDIKADGKFFVLNDKNIDFLGGQRIKTKINCKNNTLKKEKR